MDVDDLYGLPRDRFVAERTALARALRADGRRDEAADVAGLRKPSVVAWAVNQLVRTAADGVAALLAAGDGVRAAQAALLAGGGDRAALRDAAESERAAVERLVAAGRGLLGSGAGAAVLDRVAETLHAAALDDDARAAVTAGRLERELSHVGLGATPTGQPQPRAKPATAPRSRVDRDERERAARERAEAARREQDRAQARRAARAAEATARRELESAERGAHAAVDRRDRAAAALAAADQELAAAQARVAVAAAEHRRARAERDG